MNVTRVSQAHKLVDKIHDIDLQTLDAKTVGEVRSRCWFNQHF